MLSLIESGNPMYSFFDWRMLPRLEALQVHLDKLREIGGGVCEINYYWKQILFLHTVASSIEESGLSCQVDIIHIRRDCYLSQSGYNCLINAVNVKSLILH